MSLYQKKEQIDMMHNATLKQPISDRPRFLSEINFYKYTERRYYGNSLLSDSYAGVRHFENRWLHTIWLYWVPLHAIWFEGRNTNFSKIHSQHFLRYIGRIKDGYWQTLGIFPKNWPTQVF